MLRPSTTDYLFMMGHGLYMSPTLIENVGADARVLREEIFGPVGSLMTFTDTDDAIAQGCTTRHIPGAEQQLPPRGRPGDIMQHEIRDALALTRSSTARERTVDITMTGRHSGEPRRIEIWFYRFGQANYLRQPASGSRLQRPGRSLRHLNHRTAQPPHHTPALSRSTT